MGVAKYVLIPTTPRYLLGAERALDGHLWAAVGWDPASKPWSQKYFKFTVVECGGVKSVLEDLVVGEGTSRGQGLAWGVLLHLTTPQLGDQSVGYPH